jgi:hypothetical protein
MKNITPDKVLYSKGKNDECYTPAYAVEPILKYIERFVRHRLFIRKIADIAFIAQENKFNKRQRKSAIGENLIVWCPFDKAESEYVKQISKLENVDVVYSHIEDGKDFFEYEPETWDVMVSNPPFTGTRKIFDRALSFKKPFALLANLARLNDKYPAWCFYEHGKQMQLMKFDKRIEFIMPEKSGGKIPFQTGYICYNFLQKDLILAELHKEEK